MKLLVTGANGFLGRYVVAEAARQGHHVRALVRPGADLSGAAWSSDPNIQIVRADLLQPDRLIDALRGADCVIHLAAAKDGDFDAQYQQTVVATENLLTAMASAGVGRLVAVSSFSVYDFLKAPAAAPLDESSPLESDGPHRDAYARAKLAQEMLIRQKSAGAPWELVVLRPGMIWGPGQLLNAWIGIPLGSRTWLRTGGGARIPLTYVENCAAAIMLAADAPAGETFNVVDDELPTQRQFCRLIWPGCTPRPRLIALPYTPLRYLARAAWFIQQRILGGRGKMPGLLIPARLAARARPLAYSNARIKERLGWRPQFSLAQSLRRSLHPAPIVPLRSILQHPRPLAPPDNPWTFPEK